MDAARPVSGRTGSADLVHQPKSLHGIIIRHNINVTDISFHDMRSRVATIPCT